MSINKIDFFVFIIVYGDNLSWKIDAVNQLVLMKLSSFYDNCDKICHTIIKRVKIQIGHWQKITVTFWFWDYIKLI